MASEAEMFHKGERLISPSQTLPRSSVSVRRGRGTIDSLNTHEMSYVCVCFLMQTHTHTHTSTLTCMVEEMLERERPSRSDSRLGETTDDFGVFEGAGETKRRKDKGD